MTGRRLRGSGRAAAVPAWILACLLVVSTAAPGASRAGCVLEVDPAEARVLAGKVWRNESGGSAGKLLWWNPGEAFPSLGIGHFIWYPPGPGGPFRESFPELVAFMGERGVPVPDWLRGASPWHSREQFLAARDGPRAAELRRLLEETVALQAEFMVARLDAALPDIVAGLPAAEVGIVRARFCALARLPAGRYALVDYVNFKGEGTHPGERYRGEGWGLLQVLREMRDLDPANAAFADAAARVLERRIANAPADRREQRWREGWLRRVDSYRHD